MKTFHVRIALALSLLLAATLACGGSFSTANVANAYTTANPDDGSATTVFAQDQVFYAVVELANAPEDTQVKAVWTAVSIDGYDPNTYLDETVLSSGDGKLTFEISNEQLSPLGQYKVDLYLNDTLGRTLTFEVR
jgi:hypothetical protein